MSRVQVPSLTPSEGAPDLRKRRSGSPSLPALPPRLGLFRGQSLGSQRGLPRPCAGKRDNFSTTVYRSPVSSSSSFVQTVACSTQLLQRGDPQRAIVRPNAEKLVLRCVASVLP